MANWDNHIKQAEHNEELAEQLASDSNLKHWDWLITIAFYAAIHYVEAVFFFEDDIGHTETACPSDMGKHAYRAQKVRERLGHTCFKSYRKLANACYNVRYLGLANTTEPTKIAMDYYSLIDAKFMHSNDLARVRNAVKAKLRR